MKVQRPCSILFFISSSATICKASTLPSVDFESQSSPSILPQQPHLTMSFSIMRFDSPPSNSPIQDTSNPTLQQRPQKRRREESSEESTGEATVKRTRTSHRLSWPRHWYNAEGKIPCQAQACDKIFNDDRDGDQSRCSHVSGTRSAEHQIIFRMERQVGCVYCDYRVVYRERRQLFNHEQAAHGTFNMSTLTGFIKLARRGKIVGDLGTLAAQPIFDRMITNLYRQFPSAPRLLYYRAHDLVVDRVEREDLVRLLAPDWTGPDDGTLPGTTLIHPKRFLWHLRPDWSQPTWEERWWSQVWTILRKMYKKGVI